MQSRSNLKSCVVVKQEGYVSELVSNKNVSHVSAFNLANFFKALPQPLLQT
jgi:hypothetical protein